LEDKTFIAQLCRIKAFQPSSEYRSYLDREKLSKTRNQLGQERADAINKHDGWNVLLGLFNDLTYDGNAVRFNLFDPDSVGAHPVVFDSDEQAIFFPKLRYSLNSEFNGHDETLSIIINPCISEGVHTKLITRPTFSCTPQKFLSSSGEIGNFFSKSVDFTDELFKVIRKFYIEKTYIPDVSVGLAPYCNADMFVMGYSGFKDWVKSSMNNEKEQILASVTSNKYVSAGKDILNNLVDVDKKASYNWFSRTRSGTNAIYGINGDDNYCRVLGIIDNYPGIITADLTKELLMIMDSNGSCKKQ